MRTIIDYWSTAILWNRWQRNGARGTMLHQYTPRNHTGRLLGRRRLGWQILAQDLVA